MTASLLKLYHSLPSPLQSVAVAGRGAYLRWWRYGQETERQVEEALQRERWSEDAWSAWRDERLATLLHRAATCVPYYRAHWERRRRAGDRASWEVLANWPVLEKAMLRTMPDAFVADDSPRVTMFHEHTSGTTGTSLDLWWSRSTVRGWYALFEARWRRWYGVSRQDRWAIIGGQLVTPVARRRPPFWVWNPALRQLYLSAYHLAPDLIPHYLEAMRRYRVRYVFAYPSALHALATAADPAQAKALDLVVAIANAEPVFSYQRDAIESAFGCPLRETYGMSEIVAAASECEAQRLHLWPEAGTLETLNGDTTVPVGEVGDIVGTGLLNMDMPLIRYRVGDRGALDVDAAPCACGRMLPRLARLEGRIDDVLYTRDGRAVGRMDPVFKSRSPILEAQIIQEALDRVRLRVVPGHGYSDADGTAVAERIRDRLGDVTVIVEAVPSIARTGNGKLRSVLCAIPPAQQSVLEAAARRSR